MNIYVKKNWNEENIIFYIHFHNNEAIRQIEVSSKNKIFLTFQNSIQGESMLFDQNLEALDLEEKDFITEKEFNSIWEDKL